jgi:DNA-binding response OmpR family regulator
MLVDDNQYELDVFKYYFPQYNIIMHYDPELAYKEILKEQFIIIIVDIYMPKMNGLELFKHIKDSPNKEAYTIAYTGATSKVVYEVINELGFDEIIEKPVNLDLLALKLQTLIRKHEWNTKPVNNCFTEDKVNFTFLLNGSNLVLTYKEYEILKLLNDKNGEIITHKEIFDSLYGNDERGDNIIKSHIKNLRYKISKVDSVTEYIRTVPLKGYKLIYQ